MYKNFNLIKQKQKKRKENTLVVSLFSMFSHVSLSLSEADHSSRSHMEVKL